MNLVSSISTLISSVVIQALYKSGNDCLVGPLVDHSQLYIGFNMMVLQHDGTT